MFESEAPIQESTPELTQEPVPPPIPELNKEPAIPTFRGNLGLIVIIGALSAFGPLSIDMYLPGLPSLQQDLHAQTWEIQLTLTACLLGLAVGQIIAGPLSDAYGRKRPLLIGLFVFMEASLICTMAPTAPVLIMLRFIQGLAGAAGIVIARAIVRDLFSGVAAARFFALTMAINGLAPILAPVIGGQLLNFTNWRGVFVLLTIIGFILLVAAWLGLRETLPREKRRGGGIDATLLTFKGLLLNRIFVGYALSSGLALAAMFAYISGSPFVLEDIYQVSPQIFSLIFATNALGIIASSQASGRMVGIIPARQLLSIGLRGSLIGGILLLVAVILNVGLIGVLPGFFLIVASIGFISPNATALALADHPRIAGTASGLMGVLQYVIGAIVSPLVTLGGTGTALPMAFIIAASSFGAFVVFRQLTRLASPTL